MKNITDSKAFENFCYKKHLPTYKNVKGEYSYALVVAFWELWQAACTHKENQIGNIKPHGLKGRPKSLAHKAKIAKAMQNNHNATHDLATHLNPILRPVAKPVPKPAPLTEAELEIKRIEALYNWDD